MTPTDIALYLEPPSHHFFGDKLFAREGNVYAGDQILAPYAAVKDFFSARGVPVHTADLMPAAPDGRCNVYVSIGMRHRFMALATRRDVVLSAFFAMECPVVEPALYRALPSLAKHFKRVYSWSDSDALLHATGEPVKLEAFSWPQSFDQVHEELWSRGDRKFMVMMNSNKLPARNWKELYTERQKAVEFFARTNDIELYGRGWDGPPFRIAYGILPGTVQYMLRGAETYWDRAFPDRLLAAARRVWRGAAKSKSETISKYTFALCFENSVLKGWITEKIFDCFFAGTVPVYWGAPEIADRVPAECFIDMRQFSDYGSLRDFLKALSPKEITAYREAARDFIASNAYRPFRTQAFVDIFRQIVEEDTGVHL
jgi:peptidoglycan hydrolase-like protein with peptidoglycan-binding domain